MLVLFSSIPNFLTTSRVLLTLLALFSYHFVSKVFFLLCVTLGLFTDFFDGFLARKFKDTSSFGAILDPACDKILIALMLSFFYIEGVLSKTFHVLLLLRSFVQMFSFLYVRRSSVRFRIEPNFLAKALSFSLFALVLLYSFCLAFEEENFLTHSEGLRGVLVVLSFFEVFFMIYYPAQFYQILRSKKLGFD